MKRFLAFLALASIGNSIKAQDATSKAAPATAKQTWTKGGFISISLTQVGNSNWIAASGDKFTLSAAGSLQAFANKTWGNKIWTNLLDVNYGLVNTSSLGVRKINDRLNFLSKLDIQPKRWNKATVSFLGQLRSQLSDGYEFDYFGSTEKRRNSGFFAPAYITIAPGVTWKPNSWFWLFGSPLATNWTIVSNGPYSYAAQGGVFNGNYETPLASLYGVNPTTQNRGEFGAFVTATIKKEVLKNVDYYSKLDLYANYLKTVGNVDVFWTNQFKLKVNKWINVSYTLDMLYDDDIKQNLTSQFAAPRALGLQVLSTLGVGFATKF